MPAPSLMFMYGPAYARTRDAAISQAARERAAWTTAWRIERNSKMQFAVVREANGTHEVLCSASGRPSSFKTWAGAQRACAAANRRDA